MSDRNRDVLELLRKHDYVTTAVKEGDGCVLTFPHPKLLLSPDSIRIVERIALVRGGSPGLQVSTSLSKEEAFIAVPEYAVRLYIVSEIAAVNQNIGLDQDMVVFIDDDGNEHDNIQDIVASPQTDDERGRERFLYTLFIEAVADGFPPEYEAVAATHHVKDGYDAIRRFYPDAS